MSKKASHPGGCDARKRQILSEDFSPFIRFSIFKMQLQLRNLEEMLEC